jgi:hypothetical protein
MTLQAHTEYAAGAARSNAPVVNEVDVRGAGQRQGGRNVLDLVVSRTQNTQCLACLQLWQRYQLIATDIKQIKLEECTG